MTTVTPPRQWDAAASRFAADRPAANRKLAALLAAALGLVIVFAAGFAPSEAVHHAAHDTRHSFAFPCH